MFDRWRAVVRGRFGRTTRTFAAVAGHVRRTPDLLGAPAETFGLPPSAAGSASGAENRLRELHRVAVLPFWPRVRAHLDAERRARSEDIADRGFEYLLSNLHPALSWERPVLRVSSDVDRSVLLQGRGLVLVPSLFRFDAPELLVPSEASASPVLVYPASVQASTARSLWTVGDDSTLEALVGRTRAGLMRTLHGRRSTTELSNRLGVSAAAVSQHTAVLRSAGLITTQRQANMVLHSLTPLGLALVYPPGSTAAGSELAAAVS
ncbi:helix-turn-helix domain-containing protein [Amycolatopsis sp. OK19-0408]|uniref:Helix-turn-helix domain-containing protein n=1 Tax=Amycolatopsis iheyensis TaxID=2945988 RepID=A0A9X2SI26_9PSEU|nr:helix-turn-helix domain-containing protein [Amycolatopsis iheyensis]MCR6483009.1 helix-turn-helix domain-containing protein [Amycolatopsis iheyensis]